MSTNFPTGSRFASGDIGGGLILAFIVVLAISGNIYMWGATKKKVAEITLYE